MSNMFAKAKEVAVETAKSPKKAATPVIADVELLASIDAITKALGALKKTVESSVKEDMMDLFVETGMATKNAPKAFDAHEGDATVNCQLRKRASNRALTDEEVSFVTANGVSVETVVAKEATYLFNPKYANDSKMLEEVSGKLEGLDLPADLIIYQTEEKSVVTTGDSIREVFANNNDAELIKRLLEVVAVGAVKPNLNTNDLSNAMELVMGMIEA